jgi:hypothetical protein
MLKMTDYGTVEISFLLLIAAIGQLLHGWPHREAHAHSADEVPRGEAPTNPDSKIVHFNLRGPDWSRIPEGYAGIAPTRIVAQLAIPKKYIAPWTSRAEVVDNVSIAIFFPSMQSAVDSHSERRIDVTINAGKEDKARKGVRFFVYGHGQTRDPKLDVDGLCGYVDDIHPGYAGDEFYTSCNEAEQLFSILCDPPFNTRRVCNTEGFLAGEIGVALMYQYPLLKEHSAMFAAVKNLVSSFIEPSTEK